MWPQSSTIAAAAVRYERGVGLGHRGRRDAVSVARDQQHGSLDRAQPAGEIEAHEGTALGRVAARDRSRRAWPRAPGTTRGSARGRSGRRRSSRPSRRPRPCRRPRRSRLSPPVPRAPGRGSPQGRRPRPEHATSAGVASGVRERDRPAHRVGQQGDAPELRARRPGRARSSASRSIVYGPGVTSLRARSAQVVGDHAELCRQLGDLAASRCTAPVPPRPCTSTTGEPEPNSSTCAR